MATGRRTRAHRRRRPPQDALSLSRWHSISGRPYARPREHLGTRDTHTHKRQTRGSQQRECQLEQRPERREEARRGTDQKCGRVMKPHSRTGRTTACSRRWRLSAALLVGCTQAERVVCAARAPRREHAFLSSVLVPKGAWSWQGQATRTNQEPTEGPTTNENRSRRSHSAVELAAGPRTSSRAQSDARWPLAWEVAYSLFVDLLSLIRFPVA